MSVDLPRGTVLRKWSPNPDVEHFEAGIVLGPSHRGDRARPVLGTCEIVGAYKQGVGGCGVEDRRLAERLRVARSAISRRLCRPRPDRRLLGEVYRVKLPR